MSKKGSRKSMPTPGSLLTPEATGGIIGGKGFDFQTRYAACHLPVWLAEGTFHQLFFEGTGDIDIRFLKAGKSARTHIQIKDHEVSAAEMKEVIENFQRLDRDFANTYERFTLACPSLAKGLRPIETGLARLRGATPFYDDAPGALIPTQQDVDGRISKQGLGAYADFIRSKVSIDIGHGDLCHDDRALELFVSRLLKHPEYADKLRAMVEPAFAEVMRAITASKGNVLDRPALEQLLKAAVTSGTTEKSIVLWVHNWTKEIYDPAAHYELDWSPHFDRATRRVPPAATWNGELLRQMTDTQKKIAGEKVERVIKFRGKCTLSTGLMLGANFPSVGGWVIEIPQPPQRESWRTDAVPTNPYSVRIDETDGKPEGDDLVLGVSVKGESRDDVMRHIESTKEFPKRYMFVSPPSQGGQSIGNAGDAVAFVHAVREKLGQTLKKYQIRKTRLFFYGPFALAVCLGQQLTSVGEVQLFEYQDPGYVPSCTLRT
jgi:hypothetical protein